MTIAFLNSRIKIIKMTVISALKRLHIEKWKWLALEFRLTWLTKNNVTAYLYHPRKGFRFQFPNTKFQQKRKIFHFLFRTKQKRGIHLFMYSYICDMYSSIGCIKRNDLRLWGSRMWAQIFKKKNKKKYWKIFVLFWLVVDW